LGNPMAFIDAVSKYVVIPAVMLYLAGWTYIYYFLDHFGVGISIVEFDVYTVVLYSIPVISRAVQIFLAILIPVFFVFCLAALVALASAWFAKQHVQRGALSPKLTKFMRRRVGRVLHVVGRSSMGHALLFILVLFGDFYLARAVGSEQAQEVKAGVGRPIFVQFSRDFGDRGGPGCKEKDGCYYEHLLDANRRSLLRKIFETREYLIVLDASQEQVDEHPALVVPRRHVEFARFP
jgi:hypothetical protein